MAPPLIHETTGLEIHTRVIRNPPPPPLDDLMTRMDETTVNRLQHLKSLVHLVMWQERLKISFQKTHTYKHASWPKYIHSLNFEKSLSCEHYHLLPLKQAVR